MRKAGIAVLGGLVALGFAAPAHAATTIGQTFVPLDGSCFQANVTVLQTTAPSNGYAAPTDGVITSWSHQTGPEPFSLRFKVARSAGGGSFTTIGQDNLRPTTADTLNTFPVRIPVRAGDVIGAHFPTLGDCGVPNEDYGISATTGDIGTGATAPYMAFDGAQIDLSATLEPDADTDAFGDETQDNCPALSNPGQGDNDGDDEGDACDADDDDDGVVDGDDNCPTDSNPGQEDTDGDEVGDACETDDDADDDNDGVLDGDDNCPTDSNPDQADNDGDGDSAGGDACDADDDNDGDLDGPDNCVLIPNPDQADNDGDGDGEGGDTCDADDDNDGDLDGADNCVFTVNPDQADNDGDTEGGDACDADDDNDGTADTADACPTQAAPTADGCPDTTPPDTATPDTTPPDVKIDSGPKRKTKDKTPTFTFSSADTSANFSCSIDGGAAQSCTSPFTSKKLKSGKHTFSVIASDTAGNKSAAATQSFKVKKKKKKGK